MESLDISHAIKDLTNVRILKQCTFSLGQQDGSDSQKSSLGMHSHLLFKEEELWVPQGKLPRRLGARPRKISWKP